MQERNALPITDLGDGILLSRFARMMLNKSMKMTSDSSRLAGWPTAENHSEEGYGYSIRWGYSIYGLKGLFDGL